MQPPNLLKPFIRNQTSRAVPAGMQALCDGILARHGKATAAILFYGSCFRKGDAFDGLVDLYVLVDDYRAAYRSRLQAVFNFLLPPNVYYLEVSYNGQILRGKYTVISLADFQRGSSMDWFHSYIWGRFSQPAGLLHVRNERDAEVNEDALGDLTYGHVNLCSRQAEQWRQFRNKHPGIHGEKQHLEYRVECHQSGGLFRIMSI